HDMPVSEDSRWLTLVAPEDQDGPEILLEPAPVHFEPSKVFQEQLFKAGIPWTGFYVDSVKDEHARLVEKGVQFKVEPMDVGTARIAVFDDTNGNYIQIVEML
ncbi:MAG: VOC family protein, partial [Bacteroidota bacterium]